MEQKSLKKNAFYSVLKVFLSLIFPLITFPYASRILLPEGIGKVNFANSIVSYFILIASLGIGSYATREAVKVRENKQALTKLFKEIITINFVCCLIAYILFIVALFSVRKFYDYKDLLLVCSIKILFSVIGIDWIYTANEDFKYITFRSFCIQLLSLIYLFIFVHTKDDIVHYAIFGLLTAVGSNIFNFFLVGKYIDLRYKTKLEFKKHLKAIIVFFGITIVTSIYTMLDTTMLGFLSNDIEVGFYTAGTKLSHMVLNLLTAIMGVLLPRFTNYSQKKDKQEFIELIYKASNILILLSIPMISGLIILSKYIILILSGEKFLSAVPVMITLSPLLFVISFGSLIGGQVLPSINKEKIAFYSYICGSITNVSLNLCLIPTYGALGAAIGTICAECMVTFIQIIYTRKYIFTKQLFITLLQSILSSLIMIIIIQLLINFINNIILKVIVCSIVGLIIYSFILFLFQNKYFILYTHQLIDCVLSKFKKE